MILRSLRPLQSSILQVVLAILVLVGCGPFDVGHAAIAAARLTLAGKPLPADGSTALAEQDAALLNAWFERNFIQAYRTVGHRSPKWDAAAEAFLRESAPSFLGLVPEISKDLLVRAKTTLDTGCDDPAVLYFAARAWAANNPQSREASELFERAVAGMHDTAYPRGVARFVASGLRRDYERRQEGTGKRAALDPVELRWFKESLSDGSYGPDEDVVIATDLGSGTGRWLFRRNLAAVGSAVEATPWIDPWVRRLVAGMRHVDEAWNSRGQDFANKVKAEEWKGMRESLTGARKALTESWRLRPDRPEAAAAMISVAMADADGEETPRLWFDRSVAARFDYMPAYEALQSALRRRWSGDPGALLAFARECAATRRFDTEVPFQAYEAVEQMEWDADDEARRDGDIDDPEQARQAAAAAVLPPSPYKNDDVYELVSTVLMRYRRNPGNARWQRYASYQVAVDYKAERYDAARKLLDDLAGVLDPGGRQEVGGTWPEARIYALASPLGSDVKQAEDLYRAGKVEEALVRLGKAHGAAPAQALPYFDQRQAAGRDRSRHGRRSGDHFLLDPDACGMDPGEWDVEGGRRRRPRRHLRCARTSHRRRRPRRLRRRDLGRHRSRVDIQRPVPGRHPAGARHLHLLPGLVQLPRQEDGARRPGRLLLGGLFPAGAYDPVPRGAQEPGRRPVVEWPSLGLHGRQAGGHGLRPRVEDDTERRRAARLRRLCQRQHDRGAVSQHTCPAADGVARPSGRTVDGGRPRASGPMIVRRPATRPLLLLLVGALGALSYGFQSSEQALLAEMNDAIEQVKRIVNQPVTALPRTPDAAVSVSSPGWFHEGAARPDFLSVDVRATQQFPYKHEYVTSDITPGLMFRGAISSSTR